MAKQAYIFKRFAPASLALIETINSIISEYQRQGFVLTVRQLYYQLVARDVIPNTLRSYKNIASLLNDARLAGAVDWDMIEDRTRAFVRRTRWGSGSEIVEACVRSYHQDQWINQDRRVFVLVEKEALVGVLERTCHQYDVPLLAARGYPSVSVIREFVIRDIIPSVRAEQGVLILHLGDHDPSGIDMTRDLRDRIELLAGAARGSVEVRRIALNMDQVEEQSPPENPAKTTDSRFEAYREKFGDSSWELDALSPRYLAELIEGQIEDAIDRGPWENIANEIADVKDRLQTMADTFDGGE